MVRQIVKGHIPDIAINNLNELSFGILAHFKIIYNKNLSAVKGSDKAPGIGFHYFLDLPVRFSISGIIKTIQAMKNIMPPVKEK